MDYRQYTLPLSLTALLSLAGCQAIMPHSDSGAAEQASEEQTTTELMPLEPFSPPAPQALAPVPDYPEDHIVEDIASLYPEEYNSPNPFAWPEQVTRYERDIWHDLRDGFALNHDIDDARLDAQIRWYSRNQGYFDRVAQRARRYLPHVYEQLVEHDMPLELALLPVVESAYDPFAYSHGRASGMWQFIPGTGRHYGLSQDWWYDGRRDVVASTQAAIDFLSELSQQFDGDWELALAAYNAGGGNVRRAIRNNTNQGLPTDYWSLGTLPRETRNYVPKLIALATIVADPEAYGITLPSMPNEHYFEVVEVGSQIDLAQAARLADITLEELYLLNPGYNQWATHPDGPQNLLIPVGHVERFRTELAALPAEERVGWARYRIQSGDSLITIANRHQTTVDVLRDVNDLRSNIIRAGDHLLIPTATAESGAYSMSADNRLSRTQNRAPSSDRQRIDHVVRPGDSFWDISREYGVNMRQLAGWNGKAPTDPIIVGETLVVWTTADQASSSRPSARSEIRRVGYTVRNGDNLSTIANRFNVTVTDIRRWNSDLNGPYIHPGQRIDLYVDVTNGPFN
ncbi:MAG: LysM peptidoglycan-binding domain-containing protein [Natronospirillum sp.]|uniref:lytic transglycosylase n=1 Tax=Natronospirillum sp. TaxID=2812955 RepID=UPI0025CF4B8D|nr:LysM peptidoglycan-binding domain-containing protein [Natronospirillum sp.]MCH8552734.1 LysM peptidoglycan-binding domain-containing protein [Natronospirillum sp.]